MIQHRKLLAVGLILAGISLLATGAMRQIDRADAAWSTEGLEQEFFGAYPAEPRESGKIREIELIAAEQREWGILPPYATPVWAYNGTVPGPVIRARLGERLRVKLVNRLPQPTTVHWHGVRVPNAMDGVPGVTQTPIEPGATFTYDFTPKDAGTFWFHPHLNAPEQIERGLYGALIVEDPNEPVYSEDLVWMLDDWLLDKDAGIHPRFVTRHDLAHDGRWGNVTTVNGQYRPSYRVKAGQRIRVRLVNAANGRVFAPAFEGLSPQVIAVDGLLAAKPFALERFFMAPGNRVDLDLVIPESAAGRSLAVLDRFGRRPATMALIEVESAPAVATPGFTPPAAAQFPVWSQALAAPLAHEFRLDAERGGPYGISWTIDGQAGHGPPLIELRSGRFARLRFVNQSARLHPMHLHGQFFRLLAVDGQPVQENFWRDTVLIGPESSVDIGMVPVDKGLWANHCHILEHAEAGMMSTLKVE